MTALLLVRYGELALKSPPVRREFERTLSRNILDQFARASESCRLRSDGGHLYVEAEAADRALPLLRRVFGVTSVSVVHEVPSDPARIAEALRELAGPHLSTGTRFAVRARRTGQHPFTSQELARDLGGVILEAWPELGLKVDLTHPQVELSVEVRGPRTYLSFDRSAGPGGLPLGVAGQVVALVDGVRGALGAWLMMKRGCRCAVVATGAGIPLATDVLARFDPRSPAPTVGPGEEASDLLRRRADEMKADGVVLPIAVEGYANARALWADRVLFSPTVGLTDEEVDRRWHAVTDLAS